jgi:hypothetical protein
MFDFGVHQREAQQVLIEVVRGLKVRAGVGRVVQADGGLG